MSEKDAFTIKEVITNYMSDMKQSVSDLHEKVDNIIIQTTKTNGRVNNLDAIMEEFLPIIKSHDEDIRKNTTTAEITEKRSKMMWSIIKWTAIPFFSFLGWVGYLYIEHVKREIISVSVQETTKLLENYQVEATIK